MTVPPDGFRPAEGLPPPCTLVFKTFPQGAFIVVLGGVFEINFTLAMVMVCPTYFWGFELKLAAVTTVCAHIV